MRPVLIASPLVISAQAVDLFKTQSSTQLLASVNATPDLQKLETIASALPNLVPAISEQQPQEVLAQLLGLKYALAATLATLKQVWHVLRMFAPV